MRFKKGSKVEVLNKREVPSGSWWCAEIISGNGHNYSVKYDCYSPDTAVTVERVPRKAIRPCPPPVVGPRSWVPGDIVEVFEKNSWKLAEVSRVVGENYFFVRLLGSSRNFRVPISNLRVRHAWQDDKWVTIQKESGECNNGIINSRSKVGNFSNQMPQWYVEMKTHGGDDQFPNKYDSGFEEPCLVPSRSKKKRPSFCSPPVDTCTGAHKKMRAVDDGERHCRLMERCSSHLLEKVDVVASPQTMLSEKYTHASLNHRISRFCETETEKRKPVADIGYHFVGSLEPNDTESISSSVGSCSAISVPYRSPHHPITNQTQGLDSHFDDAESSCGPGRELSLATKEGLEEEMHHLELNAYRSTMMALYASGPLSWEQEALMTNLRLMLHISNDEHLLELRHLASAKTDIYHSLQEVIPRL